MGFLRYLAILIFICSCSFSAQRGSWDSEESLEKVVEYRGVKDSSSQAELFFQAKDLLMAQRFERSKLKLQEYLIQAPQGEFSDQAYLFLGQMSYREKNYASARSHFSQIYSMRPPSKFRSTGYHQYARVLDAENKKTQALSALKKIRVNELYFDGEALDIYKFSSNLAYHVQNYEDAIVSAVKAYDLTSTHATQEKAILRSRVEKIIGFHLSERGNSRLLKKYSSGEFPRALLALKKIKFLTQRGKNQEAQNLAAQLNDSLVGSSEYKTHLAPLLQGELGSSQNQYSDKTSTGKVLFLMEENKSAFKNAFRLSATGGNLNAQPNLSFSFVFRNPGSSESEIISVLDRYLQSGGVDLVVGPFRGSSAEVVMRRCAQYKIPYINISQREESASSLPNVFHYSFSPKKQAYSLVKYFFQERGVRFFGLLYPEDPFGQAYLRAFQGATSLIQSPLSQFASYEAGSSDFKKAIRSLQSDDFKRSRSSAKQSRVRSLERRYGRKLTKTELKNVSASTSSDFEVLFVADTYKSIAQIAPSLLYEDIKTTLAGPSTWNNKKLIVRGGRYVKGAVFVDGYEKRFLERSFPNFVSIYRQNFNAFPGPLAAQGYDLAEVLKIAYNRIGKFGTIDRALESIGQRQSLMGSQIWDAQRDPLNEMKVFEIQDNDFQFIKSVYLR